MVATVANMTAIASNEVDMNKAKTFALGLALSKDASMLADEFSRIR